MTEKTKLPPHDPSYTVDEFCGAERISRVKLYEMWKDGKGPRFYQDAGASPTRLASIGKRREKPKSSETA